MAKLLLEFETNPAGTHGSQLFDDGAHLVSWMNDVEHNCTRNGSVVTCIDRHGVTHIGRLDDVEDDHDNTVNRR